MDISFRLRQIIANEGKITIARFMEEIISHEKFSYYQNNTAIGKEGDFTTAPEISQLFGEMIGIYCANLWQELGCTRVSLVELGPGKGTLISDLLKATRNIENFHNSIELHFVEISDRLKNIQQLRLEQYNFNKYWHKSIYDISTNLSTIFIANEFFDALPINQYKKLKDRWYEVFIDIEQDTQDLIYSYGAVSNKENENLCEDFYNISDGSLIEISAKSIEIIKYISEIIVTNNGGGLFIDYGYNKSYGERSLTGSTLQAVKNHKFHPVLSDIGQADISAHVDFYALAQAAKLKGMKVQISTQREFLLSQGIQIRANMLSSKNPELEKTIYSGLNRLIDLDQMGELFKVLLIKN